jgi:hypothetical protein
MSMVDRCPKLVLMTILGERGLIACDVKMLNAGEGAAK